MTDEKVALVFEKTTVARVQEIYRGFLTNCPDASQWLENSLTASVRNTRFIFRMI